MSLSGALRYSVPFRVSFNPARMSSVAQHWSQAAVDKRPLSQDNPLKATCLDRSDMQNADLQEHSESHTLHTCHTAIPGIMHRNKLPLVHLFLSSFYPPTFSSLFPHCPLPSLSSSSLCVHFPRLLHHKNAPKLNT